MNLDENPLLQFHRQVCYNPDVKSILLENEQFMKLVQKKILSKFQNPQTKIIWLKDLKDFRIVMRDLQLVPNFMSEYKVAQAF